MAGVKGKSGGARPNSGGKRAGAGRKPKVAAAESANAPAAAVRVEMEAQLHGGALKRLKSEPVEVSERDMLQFLQDVALGRIPAATIQVRAAIAAVQYTHRKKGDGGKADEVADKAKAAGAGKYGMRQGPRLVASK